MPDRIVVTIDPQIAAIVPRFLENRAADVARIREALAGGEFETIRVAGHGMKGAGGAYGFAEISRLGAALEEAARRSDAGAVSALAAGLEEYLGRVEVKCG